MKPRKRTLSAIQHQVPDRIPTDAIHVENTAEVAAFLNIPPQDVLDRLGIDGRVVSAPYCGEPPHDNSGTRLSEWGTPDTGDYGTARLYPLATVTTIAEIEAYPWPSVTDYDYAAAATVVQQIGHHYAVRGPYWKPLFCQVCDLAGMEQAMTWMLTEPLLFEAMLEQVFVHTLEFCERLLTACGDTMPILCLGDDFATQRGLMLSPALWRQSLRPRYAHLFALGKRMGKAVWFHSCGDITAVLPDLIDIGMDVWETVQLHTLPLTPQQLKREYGRHITFFGGVNTQHLPFATPEEVKTETLRCIEWLAEGGGYICGPDHHIKPDVPAANALALFDTAHAFRREGYTR
ncbi:MAG: uroporphyrinogen decarboxylase family protein [Chloroflexi bacterium]|nr:uroporphyrinogen decarboxylase family protein [Chloroflexota bacterium]